MYPSIRFKLNEKDTEIKFPQFSIDDLSNKLDDVDCDLIITHEFIDLIDKIYKKINKQYYSILRMRHDVWAEKKNLTVTIDMTKTSFKTTYSCKIIKELFEMSDFSVRLYFNTECPLLVKYINIHHQLLNELMYEIIKKKNQDLCDELYYKIKNIKTDDHFIQLHRFDINDPKKKINLYPSDVIEKCVKKLKHDEIFVLDYLNTVYVQNPNLFTFFNQNIKLGKSPRLTVLKVISQSFIEHLRKFGYQIKVTENIATDTLIITNPM